MCQVLNWQAEQFTSAVEFKKITNEFNCFYF